MRLASMVLTLVLVAGAAAANPLPPLPPQQGVYYSFDLPGGSFLAGRFSESWPFGGPGQVGNTVNAASWDGATLGTEWRLWCPHIMAPPTLIADTRVNGTGAVMYLTYYLGGLFWFSAGGPWSADHAIDFTGTVDQFSALTTYHYVGGQLQGIRSNITTIGTFDDLVPGYWSERCFDYTINNAAFYGSSPNPKPADFPDYIDQDCSSPVLAGGWGSATEIALTITECAVPSRPATWGEIKAKF